MDAPLATGHPKQGLIVLALGVVGQLGEVVNRTGFRVGLDEREYTVLGLARYLQRSRFPGLSRVGPCEASVLACWITCSASSSNRSNSA